MAGAKRTEVRESRKARLTGLLAGWLIRVWTRTLRVEVADRAGIGGPQQKPVIYVLWHDRIFVVPAAWRRLVRGSREAVVLTSASHDGAALAHAMSVFGMGAVRGSSSRRGVAALIALKKAVKAGRDVCITPDGPRGPRHVLQPGAVALASSTGAAVVPVHVRYFSAWRLRTWDRFCIPKPFSRVRIVFDAALVVPPALSEDAAETERARIESILRADSDDSDDS